MTALLVYKNHKSKLKTRVYLQCVLLFISYYSFGQALDTVVFKTGVKIGVTKFSVKNGMFVFQKYSSDKENVVNPSSIDYIKYADGSKYIISTQNSETQTHEKIAANKEDSAINQKGLTVKFSPTLFIIEEGITVQYTFNNYWGIMMGGGYNTNLTNNTEYRGISTGEDGLTGRLGILKYYGKSKKKYLSLQGFYRYWRVNAVGHYDYPSISNRDVTDEIINPVFSLSNNFMESEPLYLYHASVKVFCIDAINGIRYKEAHLNFEFYYGLGIRCKLINIQQDGYYQTTGYTPTLYVATPSLYNNNVIILPDIKLGFTLGYNLFCN